jgi:hypothetical protein
MTMTEMSAAFLMRSDNAGSSGVPLVVLGLNVLVMAAGGAVPILRMAPSLYKNLVND